MAKIEPRSPKSTMSAQIRIGESPKRPKCTEFNRTQAFETSPERANWVENDEPTNVNGEPRRCAEMKKWKVKSANKIQNGELPNKKGDPILTVDSSM